MILRSSFGVRAFVIAGIKKMEGEPELPDECLASRLLDRSCVPFVITTNQAWPALRPR